MYAHQLYKEKQQAREENQRQPPGSVGLTNVRVVNEDRNITSLYSDGDENGGNPAGDSMADTQTTSFPNYNQGTQYSPSIVPTHPTQFTSSARSSFVPTLTPASTPTSTPVRVPSTPTNTVNPLSRTCEFKYMANGSEDGKEDYESKNHVGDERGIKVNDKGKGVDYGDGGREIDDDEVSITVPGFTWRRGMASIANVDSDDG
jgi:hypothetical protein